MSIVSEITRLQTAKANLKTAINNKGGSLTTETIDQYPTAINALQTGIDVSDANAVVGDVLTGKTFYAVDDTKKTGTMSNRGSVNTDITTKAQEVTIQQGYHSGSGKVKISTTEQAKIIADNIKSGVSILGQAGGLTPAKAEETKTITSPDFSSGNVVVTPTTDKVMTQVTVNKDTTNHIASNIRSGKTLYGVTGNLQPAKEEETKTVTPNFASGNVVVTPTSGKVLSQVTFSKDTTNHIAGNIKKDITLYGVTGTYEGEGETLPTLNAPTISLSDSTVTITNPATNGNFATGYKIYINGTLLVSLVSITLTTVDLSAYITEVGNYTITVKAKGTNFNESVASNSVEYTAVPSVSFVQVYPEKDGEYSTLSNMNTSKIYSVKDYGYFQYSNGSWNFNWSDDDLYASSQTQTSVTFYTGIGGDFMEWEDIIVVEGDTIATQVDYSGMTGTKVLAVRSCFVEGTLITMADGSQKKVEDIEYGDEVLCYDFEKGEQTTSYIDWMIPKQTATEYWKITLSDGTTLKLVGPKDGPNKDKSHRLYNVTKQSFIYPQDFEKDDLTLKENGDLVKVVSCEKIFEPVNFYNIASNKHINVYAENVLTSNRLNNRFEIKNNKFTDKKLMTDGEIKAYKEHLERLKK